MSQNDSLMNIFDDDFLTLTPFQVIERSYTFILTDLSMMKSQISFIKLLVDQMGMLDKNLSRNEPSTIGDIFDELQLHQERIHKIIDDLLTYKDHHQSEEK